MKIKFFQTNYIALKLLINMHLQIQKIKMAIATIRTMKVVLFGLLALYEV
jgi:hypothetical protein